MSIDPTVYTARELTGDVELSCDVCIVGTGAGGSVLAAGLAEQGLRVVMMEEGSFRTRADWSMMQEAVSFPMLYQERGTRATADLAITVLQGRSVGGGTTVNWTTCFRTPPRILEHWARVHGVEGLDAETMRPHFEAVEARLSIEPWHEHLVNNNNGSLRDGAEKLGWETQIIRRNVKGCANSGYCGFGCPVDAKQAMHLTYIPDALERGTVLYANTRADRFEVEGGRVTAVLGSVMDPDRDVATPIRVRVKPKVAVCSGGAINSPALLMRSGLYSRGNVGKRTLLHPVVAVVGEYEKRISGWYGAPQSITCHEFVDRGPDKVGFFLEVSPIHPMLAATASLLHGNELAALMQRQAYVANTIALCVDGVLPGDVGGTVSLRPDGRPKLDYPIGEPLKEAFLEAHRAMARVQLAAGAREVGSLHIDPVRMASEADLPKLDAASYGALEHTIFSAHQMGGCAMGPDPATSVVDSTLRHHDIPNLFVVDGSVFPTALGVNPSESIYGLAHWAVQHVGSAV
jgi:choline dehydrogenase-like flavoprotein